MTGSTIARVQLVFGYLAWGGVVWGFLAPRFAKTAPAEALRLIACIHSFRFFGLAFLLPGFVGSGVPPAFALPAALGDFVTSLLAFAALISFRVPSLFWTFAVAFNVVGILDLVLDTLHAVRLNFPQWAGALGPAYTIPILYVPLLMLTHLLAFSIILGPAFRRTKIASAPEGAVS